MYSHLIGIKFHKKCAISQEVKMISLTKKNEKVIYFLENFTSHEEWELV